MSDCELICLLAALGVARTTQKTENYCCVLDSVYRAVAQQRVDQIRYNMFIVKTVLFRYEESDAYLRHAKCPRRNETTNKTYDLSYTPSYNDLTVHNIKLPKINTDLLQNYRKNCHTSLKI
jgi:hypothetical protein